METLTVAAALKFAAPFACADITRHHLRHVFIEPTRAYATDGHRVAVFPIVAAGAEIGAHLDGAVVPGIKAFPVDSVIPPADSPVIARLRAETIGDIRAAVDMINSRHAVGVVLTPERAEIHVIENLTNAQEKKKAKSRTLIFQIRNDRVISRVAMNAAYLLDAIDAALITDGEVVLRGGGKDGLGAIRIDGARGMVATMPMRL